jgi:hypothetical protein
MNLLRNGLLRRHAGLLRWMPRVVFLLTLLGMGVGGQVQAQELPRRHVVLDDFEGTNSAWKFIVGEEIPKAGGLVELDSNAPHGGTNALRVDADFTSGGAFVGARRNLAPGPDLLELHLWAKARNLSRVGVRLVDATGQCHQKVGAIVFSDIEEWQEVTLKVGNMVGGEHWGGANDAQWHGPAKSIEFDIGKNALSDPEEKKGCLWLDDIQILTPGMGAQTALSCLTWPATSRPGTGAQITYRWETIAMDGDYSVLARFIGPDGRTAFQNDHKPPVSTRSWSGLVEYTNSIFIPTNIPEGEYRILVGFYDPGAVTNGGNRPTLKLGRGVRAVSGDATIAEVGRLVISSNTQSAIASKPTLNLTGYHLTLNEDFKSGLDISAKGPGTRWVARTPYGLDFGEASFARPDKGFPFVVTNGVLWIQARRFTNFGNIGKMWRSGLLCSVDPKGAGFAQRFGYFEMRAKLPPGPGTWPGFWLMGADHVRHPQENKGKSLVEVDVMEQFGIKPYILHTSVQLWKPDQTHWSTSEPSFVVGMTEGFHNYGVLIEDQETIFYYDGVELRRMKTLPEAKVPLYLVVDLAMGGGGQSMDQAANPSCLQVEHIRVYSKE